MGTESFRRAGYVATTVDEICRQAGVTKGAFFHHFASKEALAQNCLAAWGSMAASMEQSAPFQSERDPVKRLLGYMDFFIDLFANPRLFKSCLAGTVVQEVADTHPELRDAAQSCFRGAQQRLEALLVAAAQSRRRRLDAQSLARLWLAALQGSLILGKAARDESVIAASLMHVRQYIGEQLGRKPR